MTNRRRRALIALIVSLAVLGGAVTVFLQLRDEPVAEAIDLIRTDPVRQLRSPLRSIRGTRRVLVFALDGVGHEAMLSAIRAGRMPSLGGLLGPERDAAGTFEHAAAIPGVISVLPSVTVASWSAVYTGVPPAENGVPGNEWFDAPALTFWAPVPTSEDEPDHVMQMVSEGLLNDRLRAPTLFESVDLRVHVSLSPVFAGADIYTMPTPLDAAQLLAEAAHGLADGETGALRESFAAVDEHSVDNVLVAFTEHGLPDLQVVYLPGTDLYTHIAPSPEAALQAYLAETTDPAIGRVLAGYEVHDALADTTVVLISDHGHTPCLADENHALGGEGGGPAALLRHMGYRVRPFALGVDIPPAYDAVLAYQGPMAFAYLTDRSRCGEVGCDWTAPPRFDADVLPALEALHAANTVDPAGTGMRGSIDLLFARRRTLEDPAPAFEVFDGHHLVPVAEYLRANPRPDLVRLEERLRGLGVGPYGHLAGDVALLMRFDSALPLDERYYTGEEYTSTHGGAGFADSNQLLIVARRSSTGDALRAEVSPVLGPEPSGMRIADLIRHLLQDDGPLR